MNVIQIKYKNKKMFFDRNVLYNLEKRIPVFLDNELKNPVKIGFFNKIDLYLSPMDLIDFI